MENMLILHVLFLLSVGFIGPATAGNGSNHSDIGLASNMTSNSNIGPLSNMINDYDGEPGTNMTTHSDKELANNMTTHSDKELTNNMTTHFDKEPAINIINHSDRELANNRTNHSDKRPASHAATKSDTEPASNMTTNSDIGPASNVATKSDRGSASNMTTNSDIGPASNMATEADTGPASNMTTNSDIGPARNMTNHSNRGRQPRIIGGWKVDLRLRHSVVHLETGSSSCTATLISDRHVLTAAHCLPRNAGVTVKIGPYWARWGNYHIENFEAVRYASSYIIHPSYARDDNPDIAVIKLETPVNVRNSRYIRIAKLPKKRSAYRSYAGKTAQTYGWGYINDYHNSPAQVMGVDVTVMSIRQCYSTISRVSYPDLYETDICTSGNGRNNRAVGVCFGDSGGPLVYKGTVIGVTSRLTVESCTRNLPSVFVATGPYRKWIKSMMKLL